MSQPLSQEAIRLIVKRHRPRGWRIRETTWRYKSMSGQADIATRTLSVPTVIDEASLFIFLHECGHVKRDHFKLNLPMHLAEYEAEQYALHIFRTEGVKVTSNMRNLARARIRSWIAHDEKHGVPIKLHVRKWAFRPTTGEQYEC